MTAMTVSFLWKLLAAMVAYTTLIAGCSPGPDWTPTTVTQEAQLASLVFTGTVVTPTTKEALESRYNRTVDVHVDSYLRGCGPTLVALSAFAHVSCMIDPPSVGQKLIAFACIQGNASASINIISHYKGAKIGEVTPYIKEAQEALGLPDSESNIEQCASAFLLSNHTCRTKPSPTTTTTTTTIITAATTDLAATDLAADSAIQYGLGAIVAASLLVL